MNDSQLPTAPATPPAEPTPYAPPAPARRTRRTWRDRLPRRLRSGRRAVAAGAVVAGLAIGGAGFGAGYAVGDDGSGRHRHHPDRHRLGPRPARRRPRPDGRAGRPARWPMGGPPGDLTQGQGGTTGPGARLRRRRPARHRQRVDVRLRRHLRLGAEQLTPRSARPDPSCPREAVGASLRAHYPERRDRSPTEGRLVARESFAIGGVRIRSGTVRALELPITRLVTGADVTLPVRVVHGREDGPRDLDRRRHPRRRGGRRRGGPPGDGGPRPEDVPRHPRRGADRQRPRLHDRRPLPPRPPRPQPLLPRLAARVAGQPDRPPLHARDRRRLRGGHRPAHRLRPPQQPPAGPRRPRRPPYPRAGRRLRCAGDAPRGDPRRVAAPRRRRARGEGAALRGRRAPALRRLRRLGRA